MGAAALMLLGASAPALAGDTTQLASIEIVPAPLPAKLAELRLATAPMASAAMDETVPALTGELLAAYVARQQKLRSFQAFDTQPEPELTSELLLGYIARQNNPALVAIEDASVSPAPTITPDLLTAYATEKFVPTFKKVDFAEREMLCLTQALYHEARGEGENGQWAVATVIINRAMSKRFPTTICGVVFQNAENGRYRCQFTFACDGRSDMGTERRAWQRANFIANAAFRDFQRGDRPDVLPKSVLYYHTRAVSPNWSRTFKRVAAIGAHIFYSPL